MSTSSNPSQPTLQLPRLLHWAVSHCRAAGNAIAGIKQQPISSMVTVLMIGIAIALPTCLHLFVETTDNAAQQFHVVPTISLYSHCQESNTGDGPEMTNPSSPFQI